MIITLPISTIIKSDDYGFLSKEHYSEVLPYFDQLQFKDSNYLDCDFGTIFHDNQGIIKKDYLQGALNKLSYLKKNNCRLYSTILGPCCNIVTLTKDKFEECASNVLSYDELKEIIRYRIIELKNVFHGKLALENTCYYPFPAYETICDANFIKEVIVENDIFFTLDISHALITCANSSQNIYSYLEKLPLNRLVEIHISKSEFSKDLNLRIDKHELPDEEEFKILDWLKELVYIDTRNVYLVAEYYKDFDKLKELYVKLSSRYR